MGRSPRIALSDPDPGRHPSAAQNPVRPLEDAGLLLPAMIDAVQYGILVADAQRRVTFVNTRYGSLAGVETAALVGRQIEEVLSLLLSERFAAAMNHLIRPRPHGRQATITRIYPSRRPDETKRWFRVHATPLDFPAAGSVAVHVMDVTKERAAQRAMIDRERHYRSLVESAPVGILVIDESGRILEMNRMVLRMLGSLSEETTKARNTLTYPPLVEVGFSADLRSCFETRRPVTAERAFRSGWGKEAILRYHISPLKIEKARVTQVQVILEDVTGTRRLERQILQARKMKSLGILTGGIAHEFNNLLQVIAGYAEILLHDLPRNEDEEARSELREIQSAAGRAAELTAGLLAFSDNIELKLKPIEMNREIVDTVRFLLRSTLKGVDVRMQLDSRLPTVNVDTLQMRQILANLALNAVEVLPADGRIEITTAVVTAEQSELGPEEPAGAGRYVRLQFRDNGQGIHPDDIPSVFDPFFSTKPLGKGHGMGLSVLYGIMRAHGGHVECESTPGEGTLFELFFPVDDRGAPGTHAQESDPKIPAVSFQNTGTIMVVDDEPSLRMLTKQLLTTLGHEVLVAENGDRAVRLFQQHEESILLVIFDLTMPEFGGERCLKEILELRPEQPVLLTSSYTLSDSIQRQVGNITRGFLQKPYTLPELGEAVRKALSGHATMQYPGRDSNALPSV